MGIHCLGIAPGQDDADAFAFLRTDRAEDIDPLGTLVVRRAGPCAAPGPAACDLVLLADAGFVLEPEFDLYARFETFADRCDLGREVFLKASTANSFCAWWRGRAESLRKPIALSSRPDVVLVGAPNEIPESWDTQVNVPPSGPVFNFADQFTLSSAQDVTTIQVPFFGYPTFSTDFILSLATSLTSSSLYSADLNISTGFEELFELPINAILPANTCFLRLTTGGFVGWPVADTSSEITTDGTVDGIWEYNVTTNTWVSAGNQPAVFDVYGPSADTTGGTSVPEPATFALFGAGLAGAAAMRRRKAKSA